MRNHALSGAAPLVTVGIILAGWCSIVHLLSIPSHLLPAPDAVIRRLWQGLITDRDMIRHLRDTLSAALLGFLIGGVIAVIVAAVLDANGVIERMFYPLITGIQSIPKVAIAPIVLIWAGFGTTSKVIIVGFICFYPIFTAAFTGFKSVDRELLGLFKIWGASPIFTFFHVKIPGALAHVLTGCEVAIAFALVGCVVVEFIIGTGGTGFLIENSANSLDTATAVASMIAVGLMGALLSWATRTTKKVVLFWARPREPE